MVVLGGGLFPMSEEPLRGRWETSPGKQGPTRRARPVPRTRHPALALALVPALDLDLARSHLPPPLALSPPSRARRANAP